LTSLLSEKILRLGNHVEAEVKPFLEAADLAAFAGTARVLSAFREHRVSDTMFAGTTGYGYDDQGRDVLEKVYADVFGCEDALVRIQFVNGTHAIAAALYGVLAPGDRVVCATGYPYDTLMGVMGFEEQPKRGSLAAYGVRLEAVAMKDGRPDLPAILEAVKKSDVRCIYIQRSRGYADRVALSVPEIGQIISAAKAVNPRLVAIVDNCYGEFVEDQEPTMVGADLMAGSLIKNPGGGLALCGGYVAGKHEWVEAAAERLTVPGIGRECGSSLGQNRSLYQGFFMAPHVTAQALKTAIFVSGLFRELGYDTDPLPEIPRHDIIQTIRFRDPKPLLAFMRGIQSGAPVDSFVTPEPWDMPGYDHPVVMAAGAFVQGSSIELSADAPMREPYTAFMQGGLTYESGKLGALLAAEALLESR